MTLTVLLVDSAEPARAEIATILRSEGYEVLEASDGMQAWERAIQGRPDLVLSEIVLARLDGFGLLTRLQKEPEFEGLPVVFLTARVERADMRRAMEMGACDYLQKPCSREELVGALRAAVKRQEAAAAAYEQRMQQMSESIEQESSVLDLDVRRVQDDRPEGAGGDFFASVQVIARLVEISEKFYQTSHSKSVALICRFLAGELGLSEQDTSTLVIAALLHDIGKAGMSERLLAADPERMAAIDFDVHAQHVRRGVDILQGMDSLRKVRRIIEEHHENHDGSGYPAGISGARICLEAQILSIASLYHDKVYRLYDGNRQSAVGPGTLPNSAQRHAHLHRLAINHLRQKASWFRRDVLDAFLGLARKGTCPVVGVGD